jgi:hypothetical protein
MERNRYGGLRACAAAMAVLLALALCSGAAAPPLGNAAAAAYGAYGDDGSQVMLAYLNAAEEDLALVDKLLTDRDLGLLEESSDDADMTKEDMETYLGMLEGFATQLDSQMDMIKLRSVPDNPEVAFFVTAEKYDLETSAEIVDEYVQILQYTESMMDVAEGLNQLANADTTDLEVTYELFNNVIGQAVSQLQALDVPSFLKNMNENFIAALSDMNETVTYALQAAYINDPVREAAASYRLGIVSRKLDAVVNELEQDFNDREEKLKSDLTAIQNENDGLADWVQKNIAKLGGN